MLQPTGRPIEQTSVLCKGQRTLTERMKLFIRRWKLRTYLYHGSAPQPEGRWFESNPRYQLSCHLLSSFSPAISGVFFATLTVGFLAAGVLVAVFGFPVLPGL
jgi:hypothetical protein